MSRGASPSCTAPLSCFLAFSGCRDQGFESKDVTGNGGGRPAVDGNGLVAPPQEAPASRLRVDAGGSSDARLGRQDLSRPGLALEALSNVHDVADDAELPSTSAVDGHGG